MIVEWGVPFTLTTAFGTLLLNQAQSIGSSGEFFYLLDKAKCSAAPGLRVSTDNIPQADGSILHRTFKTGYVMTLGIEFWKTRDLVACDEDLCTMVELLMSHVEQLVNENGRIAWTPSCAVPRMLVDIRLADNGWPSAFYEGPVTGCTMIVHTPFPYAIDV